jgi:hypothetical protein
LFEGGKIDWRITQVGYNKKSTELKQRQYKLTEGLKR